MTKPSSVPPSSSTAGLYLHIPFCRRKCRYCDFFSVTDLSWRPRWLAALLREIALGRQDPFWLAPETEFDTLYFGGGTPSLLTLAELAAILAAVSRCWRLSPEAEITLEANPDDLSPELLRGWRELGINRLSLGVQSFQDPELHFLGRRHRAAQTQQALDWARAAGFANLSMDLIYGLPGQSLASWLATLAAAAAWEPEHLSCYQLTLEAGTELGDLLAQGRLQPLPEEEQRRFFLETAAYLSAAGYLHYEVSNFARSPNHRCRHNLKYWRHQPYLGLGPAAHSFNGRQRRWHFRELAPYCAALEAGRLPVAGGETLTPEQRRLEAVYLGLRTQDGLPLSALPCPDPALVTELQQAGLLRRDQDRLYLTREGLVVVDSLTLLLSD